MNSAVKITLAVEIGINFMTNCLLNALCAWLINKNADVVTTNAVGIFIDTCITCLFICLCTTPFAVAAAKRYQKSGILKEWKPKAGFLAHYPKNPVLLALSFAFSIMLPIGILLGIGFSAFGISVLPILNFVLYKGISGGIIGGCVCALTLVRYQFLQKGARRYEQASRY